MRKILLIFTVLLVCFGFAEKKELEIESDCCNPEVEFVGCIGMKRLAPGYSLHKKNRQRIIEGKISMVCQMEVEKGIDYMLRYRVYTRGYPENTTKGLFVLNQEEDTVATTFLNGKNYEGFTYKAPKNETLRVYIDPNENPLLNEKHNKKDVCAKVRCIEYVIGTRMAATKD